MQRKMLELFNEKVNEFQVKRKETVIA